MKKQLVAAVAVAAFAAIGMTGCSSSGGSDGGKVTITYSNFISNGGNEKNLRRSSTRSRRRTRTSLSK